MTGMRMTILVMIFCGVGLALTGIRVEQTCCMARIQQHQLAQIELKRTLDAQQLQIARLRAPTQIRSRVESLELQVRSPLEETENDSLRPGPQRYALVGE